MNNIMLDLETMGVAPYGAIIAIGAVKFNDEKVTDRFYEVVDLKSSVDAGLEIRPDTVMWWLQQDTDARSAFKEEGLPLIYALSRFHVWAGEDPIVWGDGSMFDNAICFTINESGMISRASQGSSSKFAPLTSTDLDMEALQPFDRACNPIFRLPGANQVSSRVL